MKRFSIIPILLFSIFMLCGLTMPPGLSGPSTGNTSDPVVLCEIARMDSSNWKVLIVVEADEEVTHSQLGALYYNDTNGNRHMVEIDWNIADESLLTPGFHNIIGTPVLSENMSLADGFDGIVTWPLFRKGGSDTITATPAQQPYFLNNQLIPLGSTNPAEEVDITTTGRDWNMGEDGYYNADKSFVWTWDFSQVNTSKSGEYTVTGILTPPEWIYVADEHRTSAFPVYVMPEDRIEIFAPIQTMSNGSLVFKWIYNASSVTDVVLEQKTENGLWAACDEDWYAYNTPTIFTTGRFYLNLLDIPAGKTYTLRLRYLDSMNGETVERHTEAICMTIPENIEELLENTNGAVPESLNIGGDRDGGDNPGSDLPDYNQPAPIPEITPEVTPTPTPEVTPDITPEVSPAPTPEVTPETHTNSTSSNSNKGSDIETNSKTDAEIKSEIKNEAVSETVTDTYTAISGLRLKQLCASGETVLFEKNGVTAEIPSSILNELELDDYDLLEVTILHPKENTIQISVIADGNPVKNLSGTVIYLPWDKKNGTNLECHDSTGNTIQTVHYDSSKKVARFTIDASGTYTLTEIESDSDASTPTDRSPVGLIPGISAVGLILAFLLVILLQRRRRHA